MTVGVDEANKLIAGALAPVADMATDDAVIAFVETLGWQLPLVPSGFGTLQQSASALVNKLGELRAAGRQNQHDVAATTMGEVVLLLGAVLGSIESLPASVASELATVPNNYLGVTQIDTLIKKRLLDHLICGALSYRSPGLMSLLVALGIVDITDVEADPDLFQPDFRLFEIHLENLGLLVTDQAQLLSQVYGWGTPEIKADRLFQTVTALTQALGTQTIRSKPSAAFVAGMFPGVPTPADGFGPMLSIPLVRGFGGAPLRLGIIPAPQTSTTDPQAIALRVLGAPDLTFETPLSSTLTLSLNTDFALDTGIGVLLRPGQSPSISLNVEDVASVPTTGSATLELDRKEATFDFPIFTLGQSGDLSVKTFFARLTLTASPADVSIETGVDGGLLTVSLGSADGFLKTTMPAGSLTAKFDLGIGWSKRKGLFLRGSGGLQMVFPLNIQLGPVLLKGVSLAALADDGGVKVQAGLQASLAIGPVTAVVNGVGAEADLRFQSGNIGPMDLGVSFLPPTGIGVSVDAGSVHGGGFINFDPTNNRYFGALQLSVYDIAISAFGLIETTLPTGPGYSFVIVISAQFAPIQLGFGFTLNGVGGMVGINRAIDTTALANLVRAGQSEELLFPKNVIADAPTIVRDLTSVFPATQSHYVFGPLGKLGWGTPTLITGEIGVILEFPGPVVVLLGEVKCLLPKPDQALVKLNLSIDGELDFPNKLFAMDAALHDSVINGFPVSGQMAMRVSWGDNPNFIFSIGGFHPAYTPPPDFPKLQPMTLDLGSHGPAKISVSGFFAVTSNTVQVGGSATLHAGGSGITLDASVSVKALFVFQPFSFEADIDASVKISFHGYGPSVHLSGTLDGPSPWHIKGEVCVSIIWWDACLGFDVTFGGDTQVTQPSIDPWLGAPTNDPTTTIIGLQTALSDPGNWAAALVPGTVSSVARAQGTDTLIDPVGGLTVRQKTAPVETLNPLTRFGVAKTPQPISFSGVKATLGDPSAGPTVPLTAVEPVNEPFAPAQFFDMDDGKKLSSAGFEQYQAGYVFATDTNKANVQGGSAFTFMPQLVTWQINSDGSETQIANYTPTDDKVAAANQRSAVAKGGLTQAGTRRFVNRALAQAFSEVVPTFVIGDNTTLLQADKTPAAAVRSATLIALDAFRAQNLEQAAGLQVTALHELSHG